MSNQYSFKLKTNRISILVFLLMSIAFKMPAQVLLPDSLHYNYKILQNISLNADERLQNGVYNTWESYIVNGIVALQNWSKENSLPKNRGTLLLFAKTDDDKFWFQEKKIFRQSDFYNTGYPYPDYYSYCDSALVFWYFGAYKLEQPPLEYKQFIKTKLDKYLYDDLTPVGWTYDEQLKVIKEKNGLSVNGFRALSYPINGKVIKETQVTSPIFEISLGKNGFIVKTITYN